MKQRKKWLVCVLLVLCLWIIAGCGSKTVEETPQVTEEPTQTTTVEPTEETTPAPTEPATLDVSEIKVGMIFYGEEGNDSLLATSLQEQMEKAAEAGGMSVDQILVQYNSREADWTSIEDSILACVDQGCQWIVGCAREYEAVIAAIAEEYPQIMFSCVGSELYNGVNSSTFTIDVAVAQYLSGAVAGLQTERDRVGFVAAKGTDDVAVTQAVNAFAYGVWSTNPEAMVEVAILGKWYVPELEEQGMQLLEDKGCDVIGSYTDGDLGDLEYQWSQYFSMKLNQILWKEVHGEAWSGDYFSGAITYELTWEQKVELPEYVWQQLESWGTVAEETVEQETSEAREEETMETEEVSAEEIVEETSAEEPAEDATEDIAEETADNVVVEETVMEEETTETYVIPEISIDKETGYLPNVRIHKVQ